MFRQTVAVLAVLIAGALPIAAHARPAQPPIFGAYYPGGSAERYPVSSIPAERLTHLFYACLLYTSPSPRDGLLSRMPSSA